MDYYGNCLQSFVFVSVRGPHLLGRMEPDPDEQEFPGEEDLDWSEETASQLKGNNLDCSVYINVFFFFFFY